MTVYVVFLALFVSLYYVHAKGVDFAFLYVWVPIFLCLPFAFTAHIPMVPIRTFSQAAVVPILLFLVWQRRHLMRMGRMEWLIALYVIWRVLADFESRGYKDAQNYAFYMLSCLVGPYLMGAYIIRNRSMDIRTAKLFVLFFLLFFPLFLYEAKFWISPIFKLLSPLFPNADSGLSIRYGMARTAGTYEHPILACIMIIAVYRLHRWLTWAGEWKRPQEGWLGAIQKRMKLLPFSFSTQISIILIVMALMTISRGPWIGGFAGALLVAAGSYQNRKKAVLIVLAIFLVGGLGGKAALDAYTTVGEGQVVAAEAQTMIYRKVMVERYTEILMDRMWQGWGLTTVPKIPGMESVDNAFFLMALQHGIPAPLIFLTIFLYAMASQVQFGLKSPIGVAPIGFTFSGIYLMCFFAFATVYMGAQTEPLLFLLLGWGEGIKARRHEVDDGSTGQEPLPSRPSSPFRRVLR